MANGAEVATQHFVLSIANNVTPTPRFTSAPSAAFTIGAAGSFNITTAATPAVGSITQVGPLPVGVNFVDNHDGTPRCRDHRRQTQRVFTRSR
jgi:hypothetical protein